MNSAAQLTYWFLPEELVPALVAFVMPVTFFLLVLGARRFATSMLVGVGGLALLPPLVEPALGQLLSAVPQWVVVLIPVLIGTYLLRLVLTLFLGREGAGALLAMMVGGLVRALTSMLPLVARAFLIPSTLLRNPRPSHRLLGALLMLMLVFALGLLGGQFLSPSNGTEPPGATAASTKQIISDVLSRLNAEDLRLLGATRLP